MEQEATIDIKHKDNSTAQSKAFLMPKLRVGVPLLVHYNTDCFHNKRMVFCE